MKIVSIILSILISSELLCQNIILQDPVSARTFNTQKYSAIKGSPFLFDMWMKGSVTIEKGVYYGLELKLDLYSNTLYFNKDGEPYEFIDEVISFILMPTMSDSSSYLYFKKGTTAAAIGSGQFIQILTEGKLNLFKITTKLLTEVNEINIGIIKTFSNASKYYITKDDITRQINLTKKDILDFVKDKEDSIAAYINEKKLSSKKEADLVSLIKHYNTL